MNDVIALAGLTIVLGIGFPLINMGPTFVFWLWGYVTGKNRPLTPEARVGYAVPIIGYIVTSLLAYLFGALIPPHGPVEHRYALWLLPFVVVVWCASGVFAYMIGRTRGAHRRARLINTTYTGPHPAPYPHPPQQQYPMPY